MILDKLISAFRSTYTKPEPEIPLLLKIHQANYFPAGKDVYRRERDQIIPTLLPPVFNPEGKGHRSLLFEQFGPEECWALSFLPPGNLVLLSDKGRKITACVESPFPDVWEEMVSLSENLLPFTTKRDDFPITGFGHATFYFVSGRNIYVSKKHITLMEKESSGFHTLHLSLLQLKKRILEKM